MKKLIAIFGCFLLPFYLFAQKEIKEKLYSRMLSDTVYYSVIVPEEWNPKQKLPVLYAINYGMMDGQYIASQLHYFKSARYAMPNTLVVNITAAMDRIGFIYKTGMLTQTGTNFVACIKNEIIPTVEKKYNTSAFRTYIGHSYAASYANYYLQHEPEIFSGYILLAPEKVGVDYSKANPDYTTPSPFDLDENTREYYRKRTTLYYAAVGQFDMKRRHAYIKEIIQKLKQIDSTKFYAEYDSIPNGNHTNILTTAIQPALEFIYQLYAPQITNDSTLNAFEQLTREETRLKSIYGIGLSKDYSGYGPFTQLAIKNNDTTSLLKIISHFDTDQAKAYDIRNWAQYCFAVGLTHHAKHYYERTIKMILTNKLKNDWEASVLNDCYQDMAVKIYKDDLVTGWRYIQKSIALINLKNKSGGKNIDIYFDAGQFSVDNNYHVKEGLQYLLKYEQLRHNIVDDIHWRYESIFLNIGKGYFLLNDSVNAKTYLHKVLDINPANQKAKELLAKLA
jgi:predicted alpha/beta superfamily hydrolase